jgi:hypothetical protein
MAQKWNLLQKWHYLQITKIILPAAAQIKAKEEKDGIFTLVIQTPKCPDEYINCGWNYLITNGHNIPN